MNYTKKYQPQFKILPEQPYTNSKLQVIITTLDSSPLKIYVTWWRIHPVNAVRQQIKHFQGTTYQCSPIDFGCNIEVIIYYEQNFGYKSSKSLLFPPIKLDCQLQELQLYIMEPICCRIKIDEIIIDVKVLSKTNTLSIISGFRQFQLPLYDDGIELKNSNIMMMISIESRVNDFVMFLGEIIGWRPKIKNQFCELTFTNRIDRDLILWSLINDKRQSTSSIKSNNSRTPRKDILTSSFYRKAQQDKSLSSTKGGNKNGKIKISSRVHKKNPNNPSYDNTMTNIEEDFKNLETKKTSIEAHTTEYVAMDLRNSFAQFQTNNNFQSNSSTLHSSHFNPKNVDQQLLEQNLILKQQNSKLRQQLQNINSLAKENISLKSKHIQLTQQISRLELERREILEDKLKFQSSLYRQVQQKQYLKKQVQSLKQMLVSCNIKQKSPIHNYNTNRPVTPERQKNANKIP